MRKFMLLLLVLWLTSEKAPAQDVLADLTLASADDARAWEAVGRVNLIGTGFCTGALIAPNLVLTAAHCMFDKRTGKRVSVQNVEFLAGWRDGRAVAERFARRVLIHKSYHYSGRKRLARVATDIAIIELAHPIRDGRIKPFGWAKRPKIGQRVRVVSYSADQPEEPALHNMCKVLGRDPSVLVLSCHVTFGASGSPIFVMENGVPRIASIISAKAQWKSRDVALGVALGRPLQEMITTLGTSDGVFRRIQSLSSTVQSVTGSGRANTLFVKP